MADKKANLIVELKDNVSGGLKSLGSGIDSLKSKFADWKLAIGAAVGVLAGLTAAAWSAIKAYAEQEAATNKLNQALVNQGAYTRATSKDLVAYAQSLQATTTFTDEAIIGAMSLLTSFGLTGSKAKEATKSVLDLSAGLGVDLNTAAMLVGKAFQGQTETLGRYGIKIEKSIPEGEKFAAVLDSINARVGGQAQAALNTTTGQLANFTNRIGELKEIVGKFLLPILQFFVDKLLTILRATEEVTNSAAGWQRFAATVGGILIELGRMVADVFLLPIKMAEPVLSKLGIDVKGVLSSVNSAFDGAVSTLDRWAQAAENTTSRVVEATALEEQMELESMERRNALRAQEIIVKEQAETEARNKRTAAEVKDQFDREKRWAAEKKAWDAQLVGISKSNLDHKTGMQKMEDFFNSERVKSAETTLSTIASLSAAKSKELRIIGKAGAMAHAIMNTAQGVTMALATYPPPFNFGLAAAVGAAGAVQIAKISGVQLAEGGVVLPKSGGTLATIGEAGKAEAVIPLDDERAQGALGGIGGVTINVNAGTIVADLMSVKEFARLIDEELFKLQRNNLGVLQ